MIQRTIASLSLQILEFLVSDVRKYIALIFLFFFFFFITNINNRLTVSRGSMQHFVTRLFFFKSFVAVSLKSITERNLLSFLCSFLIGRHSRVIRNDKIPCRNDHSFRVYNKNSTSPEI